MDSLLEDCSLDENLLRPPLPSWVSANIGAVVSMLEQADAQSDDMAESELSETITYESDDMADSVLPEGTSYELDSSDSPDSPDSRAALPGSSKSSWRKRTARSLVNIFTRD
jgi:hypothetical protein